MILSVHLLVRRRTVRADLHPDVRPAVRHVHEGRGFRARDGELRVRHRDGQPAQAGVRGGHGRPDQQGRRCGAGGGVQAHRGQARSGDQAVQRCRAITMWATSRRRNRWPAYRERYRAGLLQLPLGRDLRHCAEFESGEGRGESPGRGREDGSVVPRGVGEGEAIRGEACDRLPAHFVLLERGEARRTSTSTCRLRCGRGI